MSCKFFGVLTSIFKICSFVKDFLAQNYKFAYLSISYDYQPVSQATYPHQSYEQRSYYYLADEGIATNSYTVAPLLLVIPVMQVMHITNSKWEN